MTFAVMLVSREIIVKEYRKFVFKIILKTPPKNHVTIHFKWFCFDKNLSTWHKFIYSYHFASLHAQKKNPLLNPTQQFSILKFCSFCVNIFVTIFGEGSMSNFFFPNFNRVKVRIFLTSKKSRNLSCVLNIHLENEKTVFVATG